MRVNKFEFLVLRDRKNCGWQGFQPRIGQKQYQLWTSINPMRNPIKT